MRSLLAYSTTSTLEEKVTLRIRADNNGDLYVPTAWYSPDGTQDCDYEWKVSVDGGSEINYWWGWSSNSKLKVWYWLTPLSVHTVTIKPQRDEYWWLKAFWYKWTDVAWTLVNIISDKSYKWYAVSAVFTWDYFKAYQYYGCTNLINTDEELLPDTLQAIWNYYRYYEYAGCTSLVSNADEKILKTVKVIGNNYRAYQYENCTNITTVNMRAINWASVWSNYRYNQFSWMGTDRNPMKVYIEGWIEEWWSWGLTNNNVRAIYVYEGLVTDYQTKLSDITSSKIQKNAVWDNNEYEFIEYIALADSAWKIRIPVGWYSTSFTQNCAYDWMVSIDGGEAEEITGTGSATYVSVGSGLTEWSEHRVVIKPATVAYGWGRAFGFHTTWAQAYIKEIVHDSYKCFATSRTDTWAHYKHGTFMWCTNLINSYEKLPTSVTTVGGYYMKECYAGCTWLKTAFYEVMHTDATLWTDYRHHQYTGCTALEVHQGIAGYTGSTYPTNYKYEYLSWSGNNMVVYLTRFEKLNASQTNSLWIADNKVSELYAFIDDVWHYQYDGFWSNVTATKFKWWFYNYVCYEYKDVDRYTKLVTSINIPNVNWSTDYYVRMWINLDWRKFWTKLVAWCYYSYDNRDGAWRILYNVTTAVEGGERKLKSVSWWSGSMWHWSAWSGSNTPYARTLFDKKQNVYGQYAYNGSNYDYFGIYGIWGSWDLRIQWGNSISNAFAIARNCKIMFGHNGGNTKTFHTDTFCNWSSYSEKDTGTGLYGSLVFSDDGMTMWRGNSWFTQIEQYTLSSPRRVDTAVTTWKTLAVNGLVTMSIDGRYMFVMNGNTLSQYTYEE